MTAWERTREAEKIARRAAKRHPDPKMRKTLRWIARRAARRMSSSHTHTNRERR